MLISLPLFLEFFLVLCNDFVLYIFKRAYFCFIFTRSDPYINTLLKLHVRSPYSCHELFGFDIMLDENLKPWVLEVNISPRYGAAKTLQLLFGIHF